MSLSQKARLQPWYQPNFAFKQYGYAMPGISPHNYTDRWSYTVPSYRLAICTSIVCAMMRDGAPTTAGTAYSYVGVPAVMNVATLTEQIATVGLQKSQVLSENMCVPAGTQIDGSTADFSTGGHYRYDVLCTFMEFNT